MERKLSNMQFRLLLIVIGVSLISLCLIQLMLYLSIRPQPPQKEHIILWWTPFMMSKEESKTCGASKCLFTDDRKHINDNDLGAYLFYGSSLKLYDLPLPKRNIFWAIYHEESPKNLPFLVYKKGQNLFDIISTFDRYSHLPITLQHLNSIQSLTDLKYFIPLEGKNEQEIAPVLYIQSGCETPIQRDLYVQELMKYIPVDSYGTCLNNKKLPEQFKLEGFYDVYEEEFMKFVAQYKFTIAIENSVCTDYITEKLWRPLIVGSVPIYLGSPTVKDWLPNKKSAILVEEFNSMKDLAKYLHTLAEDENLYNEYLQHKLSENENEKITNKLLINTINKQKTTISDFECFVCNAVNSDELPKKSSLNLYDCPRPKDKFNVDNTWKQHWDIGKCQTKALSHLLSNATLNNYTEDAFDKLVLKNLMKNEC